MIAMRIRTALVLLGLTLLLGNGSAEAYIRITQTKYRWRNDDGGQVGATWRSPVNAGGTFTAETENMRVRFCLTSGDSTFNAPYKLQYATLPAGPWSNVPVTATTQPFEMAASPHFANGAATGRNRRI